ncbi:hypothetical protein GUJ93_ZPchr0002g23773 [Zizania palustris]|uniref:Uncharacterized protein n=1 Tax=Zizania palustris TaxID=103762 RepID=A0A8J5S9H0_ZIZPA|nr:hypothetical protein GUJ93_ZPchr0002g23773 [Zizania palustris]
MRSSHAPPHRYGPAHYTSVSSVAPPRETLASHGAFSLRHEETLAPCKASCSADDAFSLRACAPQPHCLLPPPCSLRTLSDGVFSSLRPHPAPSTGAWSAFA